MVVALRSEAALVCQECGHLFMEHDDTGCKHAACPCRTTQHAILGEPPSLTSKLLSALDDFSSKIPNMPSYSDNEFVVPDKTFNKEYLNISSERLFSIVRKEVKAQHYFKVWKIDDAARYIDMTTYGQSTWERTNDRERIEIKVSVGALPISSNLEVKISPSKWSSFPSIDDLSRKHGIIEYRADRLAQIIYDEIVGLRLDEDHV